MAANGGSVVTRTDASAHARLRAVPVGDVTLHDGLWQRRVAANREHGIPRLLERMESRGAVDNFRIGQPATPGLVRRGYWFSDSDVYKWLEAAAWSLAGHPDAGLAEVVSHVVDAIVGAQDADGYLNTNFAAPNRLRDLGWSHELYCAGHLFQAAIALRARDGGRAPARRRDPLRRVRRRPAARQHRVRQPSWCRDGPRRVGARDGGGALVRARGGPVGPRRPGRGPSPVGARGAVAVLRVWAHRPRHRDRRRRPRGHRRRALVQLGGGEVVRHRGGRRSLDR